MAVSCQRIISLIENFAPKKLAADWDNVGLQVGSFAQPVNKIFLSLDLTEEVVAEGLAWGAELFVVHHTPFYKPVKNLRTDLPLGRVLAKLIQGGAALYTAHTNLDIASGGVNDILAHRLGLKDVNVLSPTWQQKLYKLVVFIPQDYAEQVREAIGKAGAGWIGNYSDCTFQLAGTGTFRPLEGTNPFLGQKGQLAKVEEMRLETIVPEELLSRVVKAMLKSHPYEEVAYDLYPLANDGEKKGLGRVGLLEEPLSLGDFLRLVKGSLGICQLRYCGDLDKIIKKVALCGGSGMSLLPQALFSGAQVFLTADIKYHEAQEALAQDLALVDAGHFATELPIVQVLADFLAQELAQENIGLRVSQVNTDPFSFR